MSAYDQISLRQIEWAKNRNLELIGGAGNRGRLSYTKTLDHNLFQPLNEKTREDIEKGDGGELSAYGIKPARMQALHSSSALAINIFDYWRTHEDLSVITASCGLSRANHELSGEIRFEQKYAINDRFQYSPNVDVVMLFENARYKAFAVESKFTEAYTTRGHDGIDPKYFKHDESWLNLTATKRLAHEISPVDNYFKYLHAAQLIKHLLGLNRKFGHANYRFLYLWYDALGKDGFKHREEIEDFAKVVRGDGIIFHSMTYQELIGRLARHREGHREYTAYMTERYL